MSSSSDIEKLFDQFGGDANAYQEIGRENEARTARTRWPLLVTLDLRQPLIPAIGQRREARPQPVTEAPVAIDRQDTTPKDAASVTRSKAPLFTRSHRRDIPPVPVPAAASTEPRGASRFGSVETNDASKVQSSAVPNGASAVAVPSVATQAVAPAMQNAPIPPAISIASIPPIAQVRTPAVSIPAVEPQPAMIAAAPFGVAPQAPVVAPAQAWAHAPAPAQAQTWAQAPAPTSTQNWAQAPASGQVQPQAAAPAPTWAPAHVDAHAQPPESARPASILGKLFAQRPETTPAQPAAPGTDAAPLQSVFDRLRGNAVQPAADPAGVPRAAAPATHNSWPNNGPRHS